MATLVLAVAACSTAAIPSSPIVAVSAPSGAVPTPATVRRVTFHAIWNVGGYRRDFPWPAQEISAAIATGTAGRVFAGDAIGNSPGTATADFELSLLDPLVTGVSRIATSPDRFVEVSALAPFEVGQRIGDRRTEPVPWDAGTGSAETWTSPDLIAAPPVPFLPMSFAPLSPASRVVPLGTFTFTGAL